MAPLGVVAAAGLVAVGADAVLSHRRAKDDLKAAAPAVLFGALAVAVLLRLAIA
ncbi:hypothetical protein [Streptomyces sp. NPDC101455]|uniref:hypothetical protein n=1 Tax=Streptomyces sp. NPDC101455 TaxID=3366142 RepID=UPI0037FFFC8B